MSCHPFPLKLLPTCEHMGLSPYSHPLRLLPHLYAPSSPDAPIRPSLPKVACNSQTGVTQQHELIRTCNTLRGNCMRNCGTPCHPPYQKSHVIPPESRSSTARKPRNINDPISNSETFSRELRAKLLSCTTVPGMPHPEPPHGLRGNKVWLRRPWAAAGPGQARARPIGGRHGACGAIGV